MRSALICFVFCGVSLIGQLPAASNAAAFNKLKSILTALKNPAASRSPLEHQLVETMMALADHDRQPSRITVVAFAAEFTGDLAGKDLTTAESDSIQQAIGSVLAGSTPNITSASRFRQALTAAGLDASRIRTLTTRFIAIGEDVRGPDDSPAKGVGRIK